MSDTEAQMLAGLLDPKKAPYQSLRYKAPWWCETFHKQCGETETSLWATYLPNSFQHNEVGQNQKTSHDGGQEMFGC